MTIQVHQPKLITLGEQKRKRLVKKKASPVIKDLEAYITQLEKLNEQLNKRIDKMDIWNMIQIFAITILSMWVGSFYVY